MKTLTTALAVIATLTLTGTGTASAAKTPTAAEIASAMCPKPDRVGHDGLTCAQFAAVKAQEMIWYAAYENWLLVLDRLPDTDNEFKRWNRGKVSLALGCAWGVKESGVRIRTPGQFQTAALATYNRIMSRRFEGPYSSTTGDCGW